jgi:phospholipid/cholesterol/gamma-HCH transport system substrate-binding protein
MKATGSAAEQPRPAPEGKLRETDLLAALPARSAHREVKVGIFVLIGLLAFLIALFTLTDVGTFRGRYYATTVIPNAGGMRDGDPVQMRGVNIGRVTDFQMVPEGVAVTLEIYNRYLIPEDSRVEVSSAGLLGGMVVSVVPGQSTERVERDQILPGSVEADLLSSANTLGEQAETVLGRATDLLSRETIGSVGNSAAELEVLLRDLTALAATQRQELALLTQSLRRSAEGVEVVANGPAGASIESAAANLDALTLSLDETSRTLTSASTSLQTVLGRLERGEGTLGRLTTDDALYDNLNAAATSIQELVSDIRTNPRRYLNLEVF